MNTWRASYTFKFFFGPFCDGHYNCAFIARPFRKLAYLLLLVSQPESIEWLIYHQAFFSVVWFGSAPRPPPPHLTSEQLASLSQSSCVSPVQLADGRGGMRWARSQLMWTRKSPALYKAFKTLWSKQYNNLHAASAPGQLTCSPLVSANDAQLLHATSLLWRFWRHQHCPW